MSTTFQSPLGTKTCAQGPRWPRRTLQTWTNPVPWLYGVCGYWWSFVWVDSCKRYWHILAFGIIAKCRLFTCSVSSVVCSLQKSTVIRNNSATLTEIVFSNHLLSPIGRGCAMDIDDFFIDLLTYTCPFTGKSRCALDPLQCKTMGSQKRNLWRTSVYIVFWS